MERSQKRDIEIEFECDPLGYAELWRKRTDSLRPSPWYSKREKAYYDIAPRRDKRTGKKQVLRRIARVSCRRRRFASKLAIEGLFTIRNRQKVASFLRESPFLVTLILEARSHIANQFSESELFLEAISDPEGLEADKLFLYISTEESPRDARPKLKTLDREWWLAELNRAQGKLCISLDYQ